MENNMIDNNVELQQEAVVSTNPEQIHEVLIIMFEITKKRYYFEVIEGMTFKKNDKVIVETIRGKEIGIVCGNSLKMKEKDLVLPLKPVLKLASPEEIEVYENQKKEAEEAFKVCKEKIRKHELEMKLVTCEYTFDKSKLIFYFTANGRIDFRELVKDLALVFRTRIELRQIGVRDEARILGDIGPCGKELCCKTFINKFDSVSVKMARDQGLVINPTKISGVCGRLLCCINYEYSQYEEALKNFPAVNQIVHTEYGEGKVLSISPLNGFLYIDIPEKGISRINVKDVKFNKKEANILKNIKTKEEIENKILEKE
ncbi:MULTISPECIES: PSP1 domain-containing protein [Fusobacterium]|uniref:PSP1 domain-containing protein n=1 Tax=Fusobacterium TaxID=848 RepID=UPI001F502D8C|nr:MULTISPECIES: stage 0 sporulation family protein [Fusobacterium]MCI5724666.1 stage 0 sporulation family protein [Fusobacterium sp.]MCI7223604.1 stage 0 sporulation family protein [Fusobacterium sp.]MDY5305857.1 stage 0 sporulation family protein [Fusobacterium gastrosuis]MDY5794646.1 stage 0 sporulation family protein [Fusobacterium gastrosuis]